MKVSRMALASGSLQKMLEQLLGKLKVPMMEQMKDDMLGYMQYRLEKAKVLMYVPMMVTK